MKRVVVGLSGGVDSSVSAYLLQKQGYEVIGMFMRNWHDESVTISDECPWLDDANDALLIAQQLNIPFQVIDLSKEYKEKIVDYMFSEYEKGRTPNPDVLCNREIKFDVFLKAAMELGADYVATGHYCRRMEYPDGSIALLSGKDNNKDQSYFLCQLKQEQLQKVLFPIGELTKPQVREIATELGLVTAEKKDSQGLCFVGKISLPTFLQQKLNTKNGEIIELSDELDIFQNYKQIEVNTHNVSLLSAPFIFDPSLGKVVAKHQGAHFYTIGQRRGLQIGGRPDPSYVIGINTDKNIVYSGQNDTHPGLNKWALKLEKESINWLRLKHKFHEINSLDFQVRIRYRQKLSPAQLIIQNDQYYILFEEPQKGITPGQFAAWYLDDELVGSGVIEH